LQRLAEIAPASFDADKNNLAMGDSREGGDGVEDETESHLELRIEPCEDICCSGELNESFIVSRPTPTGNHHDSIDGCDTSGSAGYDELHEIIVVQSEVVDIYHSGDNWLSNEVIMVLTDCNHTSSCIAFSDENTSDDGVEVISNLELDVGAYYIVTEFCGNGESFPYTLEVVSLESEQALTSNGFKLNQNFPNPFNPTTTISRTQPTIAPVAKSIYNIAGDLLYHIVYLGVLQTTICLGCFVFSRWNLFLYC
jgi:hypothetical protein